MGLFQTVDRSKLPNLDGVYEMAKAPMGDYGPAYTLGRVGIVYDSAQVSEPLTSWADLWREGSGRQDFPSRHYHHLPGRWLSCWPATRPG